MIIPEKKAGKTLETNRKKTETFSGKKRNLLSFKVRFKPTIDAAIHNYQVTPSRRILCRYAGYELPQPFSGSSEEQRPRDKYVGHVHIVKKKQEIRTILPL